MSELPVLPVEDVYLPGAPVTLQAGHLWGCHGRSGFATVAGDRSVGLRALRQLAPVWWALRGNRPLQ